MTATLLIATTNTGKARELAGGLSEYFPSVLTLEAYPDVCVPSESGASFEENAEAKALYYSEKTGLACLADDSGLEVDALDGRPGVCSARYGGEGASDHERNIKLLVEIKEVPQDLRIATFVCHLALAHEGRVVISVRGELVGRIATAPRGRYGFGYDPLFIPSGHVKTMAEMGPEEKNRISHRANALRKLRQELKENYKTAFGASPPNR